MASADDTADEPVPDPRVATLGDPAEVSSDAPVRIGFIGKTLGRFRISAELGRGGMATVYRAHDPQLGRDVAVKVMHGFFAGRADIEARFRREANAVAAIRHPSILALYDFAPPAGEEPGYIVSELIEGQNLRQLADARGGRLLPEVAALITIRVAEALGAAHAAGIVHRDVKPDNVLIDRAGGGARVVLTDFGVAHVSGMDTMTATGAVLGSPAYMSPEQARGDDVGPPSDVFSLGVLIYQLCTGHLPFSGKDPLAVITGILRGDYLRPAKLEARVGPDLEQIIVRCLLQDPDARFPDGGAVAAALRGLLTTVDLGDEGAALRRSVADTEAFEREVSPGIARAAMAAAERARRRGQIPRAIAEVGRVLAYAPDDPAARELLGRLGTRGRSRWIATGIALGAVAIAIGMGLSITAKRERSRASVADIAKVATLVPARVSVAQPIAPESGSRPPPPAARLDAEIAPQNTGAGFPALAAPAPDVAPGAAAARPRRVARGTVKRESANNPTTVNPSPTDVDKKSEAAAAQGSAEPTATAAAPIEKPARDQAPSAEIAAPPASASVVLRASHGFCEPSLDGHPPSLRASYNNLSPGRHEIFCTLPQGGGKVHVASYDLRPGTRPSLIIVRGQNGRPVLGRPE